MKKKLLSIIFISACVFSNTALFAQRYLSYVFPSANVASNIIYANNYQFLLGPGSPMATDLKMDVYEPGGIADTSTARPLIIYLPTGSFLPAIVNGTPTGSRRDSSVVEMCTRFAKRGFVAAAVTYRLGWDPQSTDQDIRTGSLLIAVYRAIQDVKSCIRFFRMDATVHGNVYKVDTNNIILVGQGSGGYVALACATLDKASEISLPKFLAQSTNFSWGFVAGTPYVNQAAMGDFEGFGGFSTVNNSNNSPGYSSEAHFVCNIGGALGDSSWLEPGDVPMVGFHVKVDPFAPYGNGPVIVPTTGDFVVDVSGDSMFIAQANAYGNNACIPHNFTDVYTTHANSLNGGQEGLYPFYTPSPQAGPWEWFDSTATVAAAQALGYSQPYGTAVYQNALLTNPNMSKAKALAYIDTIQNYFVPRVSRCGGFVGIKENNNPAIALQVTPNPVKDNFMISISDASLYIHSIELMNVIGDRVYSMEGLNAQSVKINRGKLDAGVYLVRIKTDKGNTTRKVIFE